MLVILLAVVGWPSLAPAAKLDPKALDPQLPYQAQRSNPVTYDVDFSVVVTPPYHTGTLKVWLPMPQNDPGQEVTEGSLTSFPMEVKPTVGIEKVFGNKFAYFEFAKPEGAQIIRHKFQIKVWELRWNLDPKQVAAVDKWPAAFDRYRQGESQAVEVDDQFDKLLTEIVPKPTNPLTDMISVMNWANANFTYDHDHASLQASSRHALEERRGHCSDYHGFCAAMGRVMGQPARVTYGINAFPKNSPSHCKLEAFIAPYGWVSFDVSETQRLIAEIGKTKDLDDATKKRLSQAAQQRMVSGFRDNTWFIQTRGTDYELSPPAAKKAAVVRTAYVEADGVALGEPDPANHEQRAFTWMTVHKFTPDRPVPYPFKELKTLEPAAAKSAKK
jgi:transglutaminase-like putative cysteine protease